MAEPLLTALKVSVAALILAIGLGSTPADLGYLWRRPRLLLRSVLAMYLVVPLAALVLVKVVPLSPGVKTALLVLAISAGAPLLPRKLMRLGREGYVFSLVVTSSLLAVVLVPAWVAVLAAHFNRETAVTPVVVATTIARTFLAPLLLGMLLRWPLSRVADRLSDGILKAGGIVLLLGAVALLALQGRLLLEAGWWPLLALAGLTLVALLVGHVLGGPDPDDRTALAVCCATRHVGIAILAASVAPGPRVATLVLAYLLASALVSIPYAQWRRRTAASEA
jgi:BASS family bile acid:Na+ symporter